MSQWPSSKARIVFAALLRIGWSTKRDTAGSHRVLSRTGFPDYVLRRGMSPEELAKEFSHLTLPQVYDALSYYYDNKEEIDRDLALKERNLKIKAASR